MELNNYDLASWVPSAVLAGMLALFQGREAPIPRRYIPQVKLAACLVLLTSAYVLFNEKSDSLSPRKLNALMVFGFVLHYYFGPANFMAKKHPNLEVPLASALYRQPTAIDHVRRHRAAQKQKQTDLIPEGWGMQVDGGDYLVGNQRRYKGRSKIPRKTKARSKYVLERLGSWSSAEETLQAFQRNRVRGNKPYVPSGQSKKTWEGLSGGLKKSTPPPELARPLKVISKKPDEKVDGTRDLGKSTAIVQNLTGSGKPSVFHINPLEANQLRVATKPVANPQRKMVAPGPFKINPLKVHGINTSDEEGSLKQKEEPFEPTSLKPKPTLGQIKLTSNLNRQPFTDNRPKQMEDKVEKVENVVEQRPAENLKKERRRSMQESMRRNSMIAAKKRRDRGVKRHRSMETFSPRIKRNYVRRRGSYARGRRPKRRAAALNTVVEPYYQYGAPRNQAAAVNDVWKDSFDDGFHLAPLRRRRRNQFSLIDLLRKNQTVVFIGLIIMSHIGFFLLAQNFSKGAAASKQVLPPPPKSHFKFNSAATANKFKAETLDDDSWIWKSQQLLSMPTEEAKPVLELNAVKEGGLMGQPVFTGYIEAFLLFCLVKGTIDCVDKFYNSS